MKSEFSLKSIIIWTLIICLILTGIFVMFYIFFVAPKCYYGEADLSACKNITKLQPADLGPFAKRVVMKTLLNIDDPHWNRLSTNITANDRCGEDARHYFETFENVTELETDYGTNYVSYRYIITSGIPNHSAECGQIDANPNQMCERWQWIKLPLTWTPTGQNTFTMGTTGFVMSGAVTFDHRSSTGVYSWGAIGSGDLASCNEWHSLDTSHGHTDPNGGYHYHGVPAMYSNANNSDACEHIGYMRDGAKLYGLCGFNSCWHLKKGHEARNENDYEYATSEACHLDECNMRWKDGEKSYFMSPNWPYVPMCLKGHMYDIYRLY